MALLVLAVVGQLATLLIGDCAAVYYYAAMGGMSNGEWPVLAAFLMMWKITWDPLYLAALGFQMRRELTDGEHSNEGILDHYARLADIVEAEAERREPGVVRRAWTWRQQVQAAGDSAARDMALLEPPVEPQTRS